MGPTRLLLAVSLLVLQRARGGLAFLFPTPRPGQAPSLHYHHLTPTVLKATGQDPNADPIAAAFGAGKGKHARDKRRKKVNKYSKFSQVAQKYEDKDPLDELYEMAERANNPEKYSQQEDDEEWESDEEEGNIRERGVLEFPDVDDVDPYDPATFGFMEVGVVQSAHGVEGMVKVTITSDFGEDLLLRATQPKYWKAPDRRYPRPVEVTEARKMVEDTLLMSFSDVTDRDSAAKLKDYIIYVKEDDRPELEEEEFLISDLVGMKVVYSEDPSIVLGTVTDVMTADEFESQALGNDLLEVELEPDPDDPQSKLPGAPVYVCLVPFVKAIVPVVDLEGRVLHVDPPEGLLELAVEKVEKVFIRGYLPSPLKQGKADRR